MQMCGTLVDFNLQWPPELKALLSDVNFININVELVSPECSVSWDYGKKLTSIMLTPVFFAALVLLNSVIHYAFYLRAERKVVAKAKGEAADDALAKFRLDFEKKHQMRSAKRHMCFSTINILMFIFQCGAIMFVRAVVGGLVCEDSGNGRTFLKAQADIECTMDGDSYVDARYESIRAHSIIGATAFVWVLGVVVASMLNPRLVIHHALDQINDFLMKTNCGKSALKKSTQLRGQL